MTDLRRQRIAGNAHAIISSIPEKIPDDLYRFELALCFSEIGHFNDAKSLYLERNSENSSQEARWKAFGALLSFFLEDTLIPAFELATTVHTYFETEPDEYLTEAILFIVQTLLAAQTFGTAIPLDPEGLCRQILSVKHEGISKASAALILSRSIKSDEAMEYLKKAHEIASKEKSILLQLSIRQALYKRYGQVFDQDWCVEPNDRLKVIIQAALAELEIDDITLEKLNKIHRVLFDLQDWRNTQSVGNQFIRLAEKKNNLLLVEEVLDRMDFASDKMRCKVLRAGFMLDRSHFLFRIGSYARAIDHCQEVGKLTNQPKYQISSGVLLANSLSKTGRYEEAENHLKNAISKISNFQGEDSSFLSEAISILAGVLANQGKPLGKLFEIVINSGLEPSASLFALNGLIQHHFLMALRKKIRPIEKEDAKKIEELISVCDRFISNNPSVSSQRKIDILSAKGQLYLFHKDWKKALSFFEQANEIIKSEGYENKESVSGQLGMVCLEAFQNWSSGLEPSMTADDAKKMLMMAHESLGNAFVALHKVGRRDDSWRFAWLTANTAWRAYHTGWLERQSAEPYIWDYLEIAHETVSEVRIDYNTKERFESYRGKAALSDNKRSMYYFALSLAFIGFQDPFKAFLWSERTSAQGMVDLSFRNYNYKQEEEWKNVSLRLKSLEKKLDQKIVFAYYTIVESRIFVLILKSDLDEPIIEEIWKDDIKKRKCFLDYLNELSPDQTIRLNHLISIRWEEWISFSALVEPITEISKPEETIMFCLHERLTGLPFHTLKIQNNLCLLERNPTSYIDSLHLAFIHGDKDLQKNDSKSNYFFGNPEENLEYAQQEMTPFNQLENVEHYIGKRAKKEHFLNALTVGSTIHFAGHQYSNTKGDISSSGLRFHDDILTIKELVENISSARLVVLNSCESATSKTLGANNSFGTIQALQLSGVKCVVGNLWRIPDQPALMTISDFYEALCKDKQSTIQAVRIASLKAKQRNEHPYYWASLVMSGLPVKLKL